MPGRETIILVSEFMRFGRIYIYVTTVIGFGGHTKINRELRPPVNVSGYPPGLEGKKIKKQNGIIVKKTRA